MMRDLPFDCVILDKEPVEVTNPYSGESIILRPDAAAVYDTIKGAELIEDYITVEAGVEWFIANEPKAYMVLLD